MDNITFPMLFASFFEHPDSVAHCPPLNGTLPPLNGTLPPPLMAHCLPPLMAHCPPIMAHCPPPSLVFECRELSTQWMKFFDVDQTFIKLEVMDILVPESLHYLTNKKNPQLNRPKLDRVLRGQKVRVFQ